MTGSRRKQQLGDFIPNTPFHGIRLGLRTEFPISRRLISSSVGMVQFTRLSDGLDAAVTRQEQVEIAGGAVIRFRDGKSWPAERIYTGSGFAVNHRSNSACLVWYAARWRNIDSQMPAVNARSNTTTNFAPK